MLVIVRSEEDNRHLHALQANKGTLVVECRPAVAITQLVDAEHASNEDDDDRQADEGHEELELGIDATAGDFAGSHVLAVAECVLDRQNDEDEDDDDLERQAGQAEIHTRLRGAVGLSRQGAADCLED